MRNLDNYESILDNDKNFLHGKLLFCQKGTTTPEAVYSWDSEHNEYVAITPIVYTDVNGRTDVQVFLDDKDYTIYVYKYIGNGDMSLDSDDDNWSFQYSYNDVFSFGIDINSDSITLIDSMDSLKDTNPDTIPSVNGDKIVALCGYNELGDCPAVFYRWDDESSAASNDVDIVAVAGITTGSWMLINTFSETGIFDVRHAGCFPKNDEASVEVTQSYALQKADTYARKFGLTLFVPSIFENDSSYYIGTNITIWSPIWFADGAKIVTATSLTLDTLSERNVDRVNPFILHSATNNGSITTSGDVVHSSWYENTDTTNPSVNYPPFIYVRKKFVYDGSFGALGIVPSYSFSNIDVEILELLENETFTFTNCNINSDHKIKNGCSFIDCEIEGGFFNSAMTFTDNSFSGCRSDIDTWDNTDWYVLYCEKNGVEFLDLKYRECTIDFSARASFPFKFVRNAHFSDVVTLPSGEIFNIWDSQIDYLLIDDDNSTIKTIRLRNSQVVFDNDNSYTLSNCKLDAKGSVINCEGGRFPIFKGAVINDCDIEGSIMVLDAIVNLYVTNCLVRASIIASCSSTFAINFDGNVLTDGAVLRLTSANSGIRHNSSFCNNVVNESANREFINFSGVTGFDVDDIGQYVYNNNSGVVKGSDSVSKFFNVKYVKYGDTETGDYILQDASSSNTCILVGDSFKLDNFLFSFGEKTTSKIMVNVEHKYMNETFNFNADGSLATGDGEHVDSPIVVYNAGVAADISLLHEDFGNSPKFDCVVVGNSVANKTDMYFVLNVKKIKS